MDLVDWDSHFIFDPKDGIVFIFWERVGRRGSSSAASQIQW